MCLTRLFRGRNVLSTYDLMIVAGATWLEPLKWLAIVAVAVKLPRILIKAFAALRVWVLDINTLMTIAVAGVLPQPHVTHAKNKLSPTLVQIQVHVCRLSAPACSRPCANKIVCVPPHVQTNVQNALTSLV